MDVRSFMLSTGQELVANVLNVSDVVYTIKNPLIVHMMHGPDGKPQLGFAPWSMIHTDGQSIEILEHALLCRPVQIEDQVAQSYIQNTTGLILPSMGGQILHG